jgi:hypothetical protein
MKLLVMQFSPWIKTNKHDLLSAARTRSPPRVLVSVCGSVVGELLSHLVPKCPIVIKEGWDSNPRLQVVNA